MCKFTYRFRWLCLATCGFSEFIPDKLKTFWVMITETENGIKTLSGEVNNHKIELDCRLSVKGIKVGTFRREKSMYKKLSIFILILALPTLIFAQSYGKIRGMVKDKANGEALPGVNLVLENTTIGATTNENGLFIILNVPVGRYTIMATLMGYQKVSIGNIRVSSDQTTEINYELSETTLDVGKEVLIIAQKPLVEKHITQSYSKMNADELKNIPVRGVTEILAIQPSVVVQDEAVHIRGGREEEVGYYLDGASVSNPVDRSNAMYVIQDAIEEIQVLAGGYTAEYGGANSGIVKTELKTGGSDYEFSLDLQTDKFASEGKKFLNTYSYKEHYITASFGGPLLSKKIRFFAAIENVDQGDTEKRFSYGYTFNNLQDMSLNNPETSSDTNLYSISYPNGFTPKNRIERWAFNGTLLFDLNPFRIRLGAVYNWRRNYLSNTPMMEVFNNRERYNDLGTTLISGTFTHILSPKTYYDVKLNYYDRTSENMDSYFGNEWRKWSDSTSVSEHTNGDVVFRSRWDAPWPYVFNGFTFPRNGTLATAGTNFASSYNLAKQSYLGGAINFVSQLTPYNEIKIGADIRRYTIRNFTINPRVMQECWPTADSSIAETAVEEKNWQRWMGNTYGYDYYGNELNEGRDGAKHPIFGSTYLQDKLEYKFLIINAGVRVDYFDMDDYRLKNINNPPIDYSMGVFPDSAWEARKASVRVSPRLGFSFPASDKTIFYMQYGKFVQMSELNDVYFGRYQYGRNIVTGGNYYIGGLGFDLGPISTTSYEIGFRQQLGNFASIDIAGFYKNIKGQPQIKRINPEPGALIQPFDALTNGDFSTSKGLEFQFTSRRMNRVQTSLSYTLTNAQGTNSTEAAAQGAIYYGYQVPTIVSPLDYSQTHRGAIIVDYRFGEDDAIRYLRDFGFNAMYTFSSGHPYTQVFFNMGQVSSYDVGVDYLNDTRDKKALEPVNSSSTPWTYKMDLKIDKQFHISKFVATAYVRVTNLFNTKNVINVFPYTGGATDDGILSEKNRYSQFTSTWGDRYIDLYRAINLRNGQAYWDVIALQLYDSPRQIFMGIRFSY